MNPAGALRSAAGDPALPPALPQFAHIRRTWDAQLGAVVAKLLPGEYYFTRNVSAVGTRDQNGVVSFDVRIRRRKK